MCINEKFGHILGTRSIKTAEFSWDLQGISTEENTCKSSNIKASWKLLTIAKTRARKLEIKCGDEPPWVRIPPSLPLKNKASEYFARKPFSVLFLFLTSWHLSTVFLFTLDHFFGDTLLHLLRVVHVAIHCEGC